ncbi:MAG: hypothetical protein ACT4TC_07210, partial [Myxococcaceae bacterium]
PIEGDAHHYLRMAHGAFEDVPAPFAYRVAAPLLARWIAPTPELGLYSMTLISLALSCAVVFAAGRRLGHSNTALALSLAAVATTPGFAHHFHNPYMTDGLGLLAVALSYSAWLSGAFAGSLVAIAAGCFARETVAATGTFWLLSLPRWRGLVALAVGAVCLMTLQHWPGMPASRPMLETLRWVYEVKGPVKVVGDALGSWHLLWLLAGIGLWLAPAERRAQVGVPLALLVGAAAAMSAIALNTNRMFTFALPAMVLALAEFFEALHRDSPRRSGILVAALALGVPLWFAAWPFGELLSANKRLRAVYALLLLVVAAPMIWRILAKRRPVLAVE